MQIEEAVLRRTISKNIASYRKAHGDTQLSLAEKLNYSDKSVSKWERGESVPDIFILTQIADLYGVTVSNLIGETKPPRKDRPHFHLLILALSVVLTYVLATMLFVAFKLAAVPYRSWMFFIYAIPVCAVIATVFTRLWWPVFYQAVAVSVLDWSIGLCFCLTVTLPNVHLVFVVCGAVQVLLALWEFFRWFRYYR